MIILRPIDQADRRVTSGILESGRIPDAPVGPQIGKGSFTHGIEGEGPDYLYSLLIGYSDPPEGKTVLEGLYYNPYFAGHQIAMPPPIASDGQVTWPEGNPPATKSQMAKDVVAFLTWAADPHAEARKALGVKVVIFLVFLCVLLCR